MRLLGSLISLLNCTCFHICVLFVFMFMFGLLWMFLTLHVQRNYLKSCWIRTNRQLLKQPQLFCIMLCMLFCSLCLLHIHHLSSLCYNVSLGNIQYFYNWKQIVIILCSIMLYVHCSLFINVLMLLLDVVVCLQWLNYTELV